MNILLAGQKRFGRDTLELVLRLGHSVAAVACPVGLAEPDKLWCAAERHGLPVIPAGTLARETMPEGVDLIVAAHSHDFIGRATRLRSRIGAIGYHPSLLPRHRGRDAVRWAIHMGEKTTGGTIYWMDDTVDGGPIAAQDWCHIPPGIEPRNLWACELAPMGLRLFEQVLTDIAAGCARRDPQDDSLATWEPAFDGAPRLRRPDLQMIGDAGIQFRNGPAHSSIPPPPHHSIPPHGRTP